MAGLPAAPSCRPADRALRAGETSELRRARLLTSAILGAFAHLAYANRGRIIRVWLISPWLKSEDRAGDALLLLLDALRGQRCDVILFTRPPEKIWHSDAIDLVRGNTNAVVYYCSNLHTKLYILECNGFRAAIIGSPNLTSRAERKNIEIAVELRTTVESERDDIAALITDLTAYASEPARARRRHASVIRKPETNMPKLLHDWFCLKPGRDNFKPHNVRDKNLTFCHQHLVNDDIIGSIERRFAANEPVKMLIYGDWGVGKTHTINHICWWLEQNEVDYPAYPVVIEIGDITKSTRFDALVRPFINALGVDFLVRLVHGYIKAYPNVVRALEEAGVATHVADAVSKLLMAAPGSTPPPIVLSATEYLKGRKPAAGAAMGFGQHLTGSDDLFDVLFAIGEMYRTVNNARLVFFADEAAKLEAVDADDAVRAHWENANKKIFDDRNNTFGFVYTISARRKNLPQTLFSSQLQNRLGENVFEMKNLPPPDVGAFLRNMAEEFVDKPKVDALVAAGTIPAGDYNWDDYPFTPSARQDFIGYFSRTQENSKPRDISSKLTDAAFVAMKSDKRLIDSDSLRAAKM